MSPPMTTEAKEIARIRARVAGDGDEFRKVVLAATEELGRFGLDPDAGIASLCSLVANASRLGIDTDLRFLLDRIVVLEKLLERAAMFIDQYVDHYPCHGADDGQPCTCGKRAILAEIDSQFTRSDA